jgi:nucleotide-binding universal stress UspA family protein
MKPTKILVPTDFSKAADCALQHAVTVAKTVGGDVVLMHVVAKREDVEAAKSEVETVAKKASDETGINVTGMIRVGNIFDDIANAATETESKMIIMGTHGMKGMQYITGSYAMKVITNSKVPFIVVQLKENKEGYKNIVLPLNLSKDTKQKIQIAAEIAKYFNSKIHIVTPKETDEFLLNQLNRNIAYAQRFLKENGINFETNTDAGKSGNFAKDVIKYSVAINADLVAIMKTESDGGISLLGGGFEQHLISNEAQIPVMCVNPVKTTVMGGSVLFT